MENIPKNIRQIGAREERVKVYLEDYVSTYLKKIQPLREETGAVGWLVGQWQTGSEGKPDHLFVNGAMTVEDTRMDRGGVSLSEEAWNQGYEILGTYFSGQNLCGIFVCEGSCRRMGRPALFAMVRECFGDQNALLYLLTEDGEETVYRIRPGREEKLQGYYCYFERNEGMQSYMMDHLPSYRVEWELPRIPHRSEPLRGKEGAFEDPAQGGKQKLRRRKEEGRKKENAGTTWLPVDRRGTRVPRGSHPQTNQAQTDQPGGRGMAALCAVMAVVIFVSGLGLVYRQRGGIRIRELLSRLEIDPQTLLTVSGRPEETGEHYVGRETNANSQDPVGIIVEEIPGNVYPTEESPSEETGPEETQWQESQPQEPQPQESQSQESQPQESRPAEAELSSEETAETAASTTASQEMPSLPAGAGVIYVVQAGDSLYSISRRFYGTDEMVQVIRQLNNLEDPDRIQVGQELLLP